MLLYLVRHGQSVPNAEKCYGGWSQLPLTEKGFDDARRAGRRLSRLSFDRIYSSDLLRAVQTAKTAIPGCEPIQLPLLRERSVGILMERRPEDCLAEYGDLYRATNEAYDFTAFNGENTEIVQKRVNAFLRMLEEDPCERVVAFTHEGILRVAFGHVLGTSRERGFVKISNGAICVLCYENGQWYYMMNSV